MLGHAVAEQENVGCNIFDIPMYYVCCVSSLWHSANAAIIIFPYPFY